MYLTTVNSKLKLLACRFLSYALVHSEKQQWYFEILTTGIHRANKVWCGLQILGLRSFIPINSLSRVGMWYFEHLRWRTMVVFQFPIWQLILTKNTAKDHYLPSQVGRKARGSGIGQAADTYRSIFQYLIVMSCPLQLSLLAATSVCLMG